MNSGLFCLRCVIFSICGTVIGTPAGADMIYNYIVVPGTGDESRYISDISLSTASNYARFADPGGGWAYSFHVPSGSKCVLTFMSSARPDITAVDAFGKNLPIQQESDGEMHTVTCSVPNDSPTDGKIKFSFKTVGINVNACNFKLAVKLPDANGNGISDLVEKLMGSSYVEVTPRPEKPHTSYLFAGPYDEPLAMPTDSVKLYSYSSTWADKGYSPVGMMHSRMGEEPGKNTEEFQKDKDGNTWGTAHFRKDNQLIDLVVGALVPGLEAEMKRKHGDDTQMHADDHYKVPTPRRTELFKGYCKDILDQGAYGVGFDEPEFWARTGYSDAFKQEWEKYYGSPWEPPHSSVDARYKADRLKSILFLNHIDAILSSAESQNPKVTRLIASHSPLGYYRMGLIAAHHSLVNIPALQEVVAEVWNLPFDAGYIEYSSMRELIRGTGKGLWFFMDPMGDSPTMSIEFYRQSFSRNLISSLMFPDVNSFEVLAWPARIYGKVPGDYEIIVNNAVGAMCELWRYHDGKLDAGSEGIGTFVSDSMGWQRADPSISDFQGFDGLTLPFVNKGVPIHVLSLDRVTEPGYLDGMKVLLVSYDFLKPVDQAMNKALADWCKAGGSLIFVGGTDAYNAVTDSWWRKAGFDSPGEDLFAQLGLPIRNPKVIVDAEKILSPSDGKSSTELRIPAQYPVTMYTPPKGANGIYSAGSEASPAVWSASAGKGTVVYAGVAPGYMISTKTGATWIRAMITQALSEAGEVYKESPAFVMRRGPYTAISTLGSEYRLEGRYADLLSKDLAVTKNPVISANECALFIEADGRDGNPSIIAASGRIRAKGEQKGSTSFIVQSPTNTNGIARLSSGGRQITGVRCWTTLGAELEAKFETDGETVLLRYPNKSDGVVVKVDWK
ncbi:MAG: type 1 glutamine amidotransferase family protein [Armatimonadota bacterium]